MSVAVAWEITRVARGVYEVSREGTPMLPGPVGLDGAREFVRRCLNQKDTVHEVSRRGATNVTKAILARAPLRKNR